MRTLTGAGPLWVIAAFAFLIVLPATAQTPSDPPAAPIPVQILNGKAVFISNGESAAVTGVPNLVYNEFYAAMKTWGRYELVTTPADADVIFEIRFVLRSGPVIVTSGRGGSPTTPQFRLVIFDPKTHVVLWAFSKDVEDANREATRRKNFDHAMASLVDDVKKLIAPPGSATEVSAPN